MKTTDPPSPSVTAHQHGGHPHALFERYGIPERPVVDLSVNLNPLGIPTGIREIWTDLLESVIPYPSPYGEGIREFYQSRFDLAPDSILPGNGSIELMYFAAQSLRPRKALVPAPSFHDYERALAASGSKVLRLTRDLNLPLDEFLDSREFLSALLPADSVFLGSPNNPDGNAASRESLLKLCHSFPDKLFLVDQAFGQFTDEPSFSLLRPDCLLPNLILFSSLTKFYALAGLRLGAIISTPGNIRHLLNQRPPWTINAIADRCALRLAQEHEYERRTRDWLREAGSDFDFRVASIPGVRAYPSETNFRLLQLSDSSRYDSVLRGLLESGFHVRCCRNFPGLTEGHFRVCLNTLENNKEFLETLHSILSRKLPPER